MIKTCILNHAALQKFLFTLWHTMCKYGMTEFWSSELCRALTFTSFKYSLLSLFCDALQKKKKKKVYSVMYTGIAYCLRCWYITKTLNQWCDLCLFICSLIGSFHWFSLLTAYSEIITAAFTWKLSLVLIVFYVYWIPHCYDAFSIGSRIKFKLLECPYIGGELSRLSNNWKK